MLVEDVEDFVDRPGLAVGVAGVDHDRQAEAVGDLDLGDEGDLLGLAARRLAVEVEAGLADRPDPLVLGQLRDFGGELVVEFAGAGRVAAGGREDPVVALGGGEGDRVRSRRRGRR